MLYHAGVAFGTCSFDKAKPCLYPFSCPQLGKGHRKWKCQCHHHDLFCHAVPSGVQRMHAVMTQEVHMQAAGAIMPAGSYSRIASSLTFCPAQP